MRRSTIAAVGCALLVPSAGTAHAQSLSSDKLSVSVNAGYQAQSRDLTGSGTYTIYDEDATFTTSQKIKSGPLFDVSADYEVMEEFAVGIGWTRFSSSAAAALDAQIPHPAFVGQFRSASAEAGETNHSANAININAVWRYPVSGKIDLAVSAGPSIVRISQDVVAGFSVAPETPPFASPAIDTVSVSSVKKTTLGFNAGVDAAYMFDRRYGAGAGLRYTFASANIAGLDDKVKAGGLQLLFGARLRF
jgi:hypothetical protein